MILLTKPAWRKLFQVFLAATVSSVLCGSVLAAEPSFKVLASYSTDVEGDHVKTANDAIAFYRDLAAKSNFDFDLTTDWNRPPLPAKLTLDDPSSPVTKGLPALFMSPANE